MKSITQFKEGREAIHNQLGLVRMDSRVPRSQTLVNVTCLQRGRGWNEAKQQYEPVRSSVPNFDQFDREIGRTMRWDLTRRDQYGHQDTVHIKTLEI